MKGLAYILGCVLVALFLGCAAKSSQETQAVAPDPHAGIFAEKCAKCHDLARVDQAHETKTKVEKEEILRRMQQKPGADITDKEMQMLIDQY